MLTDLKVQSLASKCLFHSQEHNKTSKNSILKILKCRNEIYRRIELKD